LVPLLLIFEQQSELASTGWSSKNAIGNNRIFCY